MDNIVTPFFFPTREDKLGKILGFFATSNGKSEIEVGGFQVNHGDKALDVAKASALRLIS
jgi:hypothetical protein